MNKIKSNKTPKHLVKRGKKRFGIKSFSLAAIAGLTLFGLQAKSETLVIKDNNIETTSQAEIYGGIVNTANTTLDTTEIGDIVNNHIQSPSNIWGGVVYNPSATLGIPNPNSVIKSINGAIVNNSISSGKYNDDGTFRHMNNAQGGVLNNSATVLGGTITEITGNSAEGGSGAFGGAIYNTSSTFKFDEVGDIVNNHASAVTSTAQGGAIYNTGTADLGKLNGAIKNNYAVSAKYDENGNMTSGAYAYGGAIYNTSGGFTGGTVTEISGNYAEGYSGANGGAIYNTSANFKFDEVGDITNNHVNTVTNTAYGGAIYNQGGDLGKLNGIIKDNYAQSDRSIANGGAIYNTSGGFSGGTVTEITGNHAETYAYAYGGAIYNTSNTFKLDEVGDITNNYARGYNSNAYGGAIFNQGGVLGKLNGVIKDNYAVSGTYNENGDLVGGAPSYGGAIYNYSYGGFTGGKVTEISNNYIKAVLAYGGAIYNTSSTFKFDEIGDISSNYIHAFSGPAQGGAIYNENGFLGELNGAIKDNYAISGRLDEDGKIISGTGSVAFGGAIYNLRGGFTGGKVTEISGNFAEGNNEAYGGAIYNTYSDFKLDEIGDIIGNHVRSTRSSASGGAIYNNMGGDFGVLTGAIKNNYAISGIYDENGNITSGGYVHGGAISNDSGGFTGGTVAEISGNFAEGYNEAYGGAIYNTSNTLKFDEVGDIINNHVHSATYPAYGGAIYNTATADLGKLNGVIKDNYAISGRLDEDGKIISGTGSIAYGGAIYNTSGGFSGGKVTEISGNYVESGTAPVYGGAIYNTSNTFKFDEVGDIVDNHAYSATAPAQGGAIYNERGILGELNGAIKDNYAISGRLDEDGKIISGTGSVAYGGAIYNTSGGFSGGTVTEISGNYVESGAAPVYGGAIYNKSNTFKFDEVGDIVDNHAYSAMAPAQGGAIFNQGGDLGKLNGSIANNYAVSAKYDDDGNIISGANAEGGAIYNTSGGFSGGTVDGITGNYVESYTSAKGGAIYNTSSTFKFDEVNNIVNNHIKSNNGQVYGGAIYNTSGNLGKINGEITNNYAKSGIVDENGNTIQTGSAYGGAIYNTGTVTGGEISVIANNYIEGACFRNNQYSPDVMGGAIYNDSRTFKLDGIGSIIGNHAAITNSVSNPVSGAYARGGAIYNNGGNLGTINGVIKDNYVAAYGNSNSVGTVEGGAIYNLYGSATGGYITEISGNYAQSYSNEINGGAIYNFSNTFKLDGIANIINNHVEQAVRFIITAGILGQ